jgi:hypothetical protein
MQRALVLLLVAAAACASPQSRIHRRRAAFDAYPPEAQASIRAGRAEVGFTREQVELALGRPDRLYVRKTAATDQEVWAYGRSPRPSLSLGFGVGGGGLFAGGAGLSSDERREDRDRIVFENGAVVSVERLK